MNFNQIRSFHLVATLGTYQAAAERLHATQPAISGRIAALENALNIKLFDRSGYRVSLTQQGRQFLPFAEQMLELQTQALVAVSKADELTGNLRLGASDTMVISWLPDFLIDLRSTHPGVTVEMFVRASPHLRDELLAHGLDLALMVGQISNPAVISRAFCKCPMGLVAAPELGLHGRRLAPEDLAGLNFLTFEKMTQPFFDISRIMKEHNIAANLNPISALQSIGLLTKKGLGVGYVPLVAVESLLDSGQVVQLDTPFVFPSLSFSIAYLDGPHRAFVELIAEAGMAFLKENNRSDFINISY